MNMNKKKSTQQPQEIHSLPLRQLVLKPLIIMVAHRLHHELWKTTCIPQFKAEIIHLTKIALDLIAEALEELLNVVIILLFHHQKIKDKII